MRRITRGILIGALISLLVSVPVLAAYYAYIYVTESNGTSYTQLAMNQTLNVDYMVDEGYITSTGLDTRITDAAYSVVPHMLAEDRVCWVDDITGSTTTQFIFFTGQSALSAFPTITGHGGYVTVADHADLELGDTFAIGVVGYIDTSAGANKNIVRKDSAVRLYVSGASEITFTITGGNSIVATGVSSGSMSLMVFSDGFDVWMEIDEVEQDRDTTSAVANNVNSWVFFENDVMPYVTYCGIWVVT